MKLNNSLYILGLILVSGLFYSCDVPTANSQTGEDNSSKNGTFVIFQNAAEENTEDQINALINAKILKESEINFIYKNKLSGISANLSESQINRLKSQDFKDTNIIPGEFIMVFKDPFNGKKYGTKEGNQWSMETIKKIQKKYDINDEEMLNRYGYAIFGFAAKLSDKQLHELDQEKLINYIEPNATVHANPPKAN